MEEKWDETFLVCNTFDEILLTLPDKLLSICNTRREDTALHRLRVGQSYLTHFFILREEEAPVCVACNAIITVKHILIESTDLLKIRKKIF